jgi:hypothetical protein
MGIEKLKITTRPKNKTWTKPQIKNHKTAMNDHTTYTIQKTKHMYLEF